MPPRKLKSSHSRKAPLDRLRIQLLGHHTTVELCAMLNEAVDRIEAMAIRRLYLKRACSIPQFVDRSSIVKSSIQRGTCSPRRVLTIIMVPKNLVLVHARYTFCQRHITMFRRIRIRAGSAYSCPYRTTRPRSAKVLNELAPARASRTRAAA